MAIVNILFTYSSFASFWPFQWFKDTGFWGALSFQGKPNFYGSTLGFFWPLVPPNKIWFGLRTGYTWILPRIYHQWAILHHFYWTIWWLTIEIRGSPRSSDQDERLGGLHRSVYDGYGEDPGAGRKHRRAGRGNPWPDIGVMGGAELELFLKFFFGIVVISTIIFWGCIPMVRTQKQHKLGYKFCKCGDN